MNKPKTRQYQMNTRAKAATASGEAILEAAIEAFSSRRFQEVTLEGVAETAGVSAQTVIRRFGSKESLFDAVIDRKRGLIDQRREVPEGADTSTALKILVNHYEQDGRTILQLLAEEERSQKVAAFVNEGRKVHRRWVQDHLGGIFEGSDGTERRRLVDAAVAATDLYTWKFLRLDLGRRANEVALVMLRLVVGLREVAR